MLPSIYAILSSDAAVAALVADRIYPHGDAPPGVAKPYVTWFILAGIPENELDAAPSVDRFPIQIDCWAESGSIVVQLASAIRDAMELHAHVTNILLNGKEPETGLYRLAIQIDYWLSR